MDTLLQSLNPLTMPSYLQITFAIMMALLLSFVLVFLGKGVVLWWRLRRLLAKLGREGSDADPDTIAPVFSAYRKFKHLWHEYSETLHCERPEATKIGAAPRPPRWRATELAEVWFSTEAVVDSSIGAAFFRHLPGVFTGIGIIGTFAGLIVGLSAFHPSSDPAETLKMIGPLIDSVREAFMVSALAITLAMIVTIIEKLFIARLHALTETLAHRLDERFDAGVGEEYLARLTVSSEKAASQASMLKDQMVEQMGELLREISKDQAQTIHSSQKALAGDIAQSIEHGLTGPLAQMEETFKTVTGGTGERTVQMLGDVMADFTERLRGLFGGQIENINDLNRQSAEAMRGAAASMRELVDDLSAESAQTTDRMANNMAQAVRDMEQRQMGINDRMETTLKDVAATMKTVMDAMHDSHDQRQQADSHRQEQWANKTSAMVEGLGSQVDNAAEQMVASSGIMAETVQKLSQITAGSIDKMDAGAVKMVQAAQGVGHAGDKLGQMLEKVAGVSESMSSHVQRLLEGTRAVEAVMGDYQQQRKAMQSLMEEARVMVDGARKEAAVTENVLQRIDQSSNKLAQAHENFDDYLGGVTDVLENSNKAFRQSVTQTLGEVNQQFHKDLSRAVKMLSESIGELETSLADLPKVN